MILKCVAFIIGIVMKLSWHGTAEEKEYRTALLATLRRIADALDSVAGVLADATRDTGSEGQTDEVELW